MAEFLMDLENLKDGAGENGDGYLVCLFILLAGLVGGRWLSLNDYVMIILYYC